LERRQPQEIGVPPCNNDGVGFAQGVHRDRAYAAAGTIIAIVVDALRQWLHGEPVSLTDVRGQVAAVLRDEFAEIKREAAGERDIID
jgi:hypothetical protein